MNHISIIGAGQLGSRHLQALASLKQKAVIQVVDTSLDSLKTAESRFHEVGKDFAGKVSFHTRIHEIEKEQDVVIVATNSKIRRVVIEELLSHAIVKNLMLEKFLFTKVGDYAAVGKLIAEKKIKAWVNCPRRMIGFYRDMQKNIAGDVEMIINGLDWGLGCNGIHYLDLFAFLTRSTKIKLTNDLISENIIESKRPGYIEFRGTINGSEGNNSFNMTSRFEIAGDFHLAINTADVKYVIYEGATAKVEMAKRSTDWKWERTSFEMPFQSQLTNILLDEILETGNCKLTPYEESAELHLHLLNNFIAFLRRIKNDNSIDECLIT